MATMIIGGEKYQMPIWLKARLLDIRPSKTPNALEVESGSERGKYYTVKHNGTTSVSCPCDAHIDGCAHRVAVNNYLEKQQADKQNELDAAAVVAPLVVGQAFAEDLPAHLDDEFAGQPEPIDPATLPYRDAFVEVRNALTLGTTNDVRALCGLLCMDREMFLNCLYSLQQGEIPLVVKRIDDNRVWVDTKKHAYSEAYAGDFNTAA